MPRSPRSRSRRARRERTARLEDLAAGRAASIPCRARRTTPRGWGAWVDGTLRLPGAEGGAAAFLVDDPSEVALVTRQGEAPVSLGPPVEIEVRPVRYKAESFHGAGSEILVLTASRRTLEVALAPEELEAVARRLSAQD